MNAIVLHDQTGLALNGSMVIVSATKVDEGKTRYDPAYIKLELACGYVLHILDAGQDCCESRYLHTDDDVGSMVGETLTQIYVLETEAKEIADGESHEVQFVHIVTNRQHVVVETHNEHNGYYGGFCLRVEVYNPDGSLRGRQSLD